MQTGCVICQDRFDAAVGIVTTKCGHVFHKRCLYKWLEESGTCPECRSKVCEKNLTKLFFNFSCDTRLNNSSETSLDELKEQLRAKDLEGLEKDKKIKDLQSFFAHSEREKQQMHQEKMKLQNEVSAAKREVQKLSKFEAFYQNLQQEYSSLTSEIEHLNNVKTIVEGCSNEADKILTEMQIRTSSEEGKTATYRIATYCSVIKRELTRSREEKTQLQNELIQVKRKIGILQASSAKKIKQLKEEIKDLKLSCPSPIPVTPSVFNNNSSQCSDLAKSATSDPSHDGFSRSEKLTPITVDFHTKKRQKLMNIVVLDKEVPKVTAQAPETPVLRLVNSALPARPKTCLPGGRGGVTAYRPIRSLKNNVLHRPTPPPDDEDSVSRIGYNGLGGHGCIVTGSKKCWPPKTSSKNELSCQLQKQPTVFAGTGLKGS